MTECDAVSIICMDSDLSRNCSPFMDECSCAVLLWRPLMNTSTQSILEMFSWRHSVTKRWPRKSLDINTGPRESCAALHVWGWASSAETAAGRGAVQTGAIGSGVRDVARLQLGYMRVPAGSSSATSQA